MTKNIPTPAPWLSFRAMLKQQFLLLARYPINLVANFIVVLAIVVIVTLVVTIFAPEEGETRLQGATLYGSIVYMFLNHTLWVIGLSIQKEQAEGTLTSFYLTPASRFLTLLARALVVVAWTSAASLMGLLGVQTLLIEPLPFHNPWLALGVLLFTISGLMGLGFAIAGFALRFGQSFEIVVNLLEYILLGLCALFVPFSVMPDTLQTIARFIPLSYAVDAFRTVSLGETQPELLPLNIELAIVIVTGLLSPVLGYFIYVINENKVRQQGTL
jgi:ABC-2 type transport system permease protein